MLFRYGKKGSAGQNTRDFHIQPPFHEQISGSSPLQNLDKLYSLLGNSRSSNNLGILVQSGPEALAKTRAFVERLFTTLDGEEPADAKRISAEIDKFFEEHITSEVSRLFDQLGQMALPDLETVIQNVLLKLTTLIHGMPLNLELDSASLSIFEEMKARKDAQVVLTTALTEIITRKHSIQKELPNEPKAQDIELKISLESVYHDLRTVLNIIEGKLMLFHNIETNPSEEANNLYKAAILLENLLTKDGFGRLPLNVQQSLLLQSISDLQQLMLQVANIPPAAETSPEMPQSMSMGPICQEDIERAAEILPVLLGQKISKKPKNLVRIMGEAFDEVKVPRTSFVQVNVDFSITTENEIPQVNLDKSGIFEVFNNIFSNALDAMENQGKISVTIKAEGENVVISVSDTGCGMSEDQLTHIFDPFFTTKGGNNCGLGLHIAKTVVEKHGGSISAESEMGTGTTFTITLPIN